jgi:predicted PurR-regulated permease PerM
MTGEDTAPIAVNVRSVALTVLAVAAAMLILWWAQEVFIPIVLGVLISYALDPLVNWLEHVHVPRVLAAGLVVMGVVGGIGYTMWTLSDDATEIVSQLPEAAQKLRRTMYRSRSDGGAIEQMQEAADELQKTAAAAAGPTPAPRGVQRVQVEEPTIDFRDYLFWGSAGAVAFAGQAVLITFFVFFLLATGDLFKRKLVRLAGPSLEKKKITVQILNDINAQIARFLLVRLVTSLIVAIASYAAFKFMGLEQAAVWALLAGVFNSIPYFGPVIVAGGTAVVAFLQFGTISMAVYVSGISLVITSIEGWLLTPWLTSRTARTNEIAVFVGLIFWSFVWGLWGTLLAVPMLVAVKAFCDRIEDLQPLGELLGE